MHDLRVTIPLILRYLRGPRAEDHHGRLGLEFEEDAEELVEVGLVDYVADPSTSVSEGCLGTRTRTGARTGTRTRTRKGIRTRSQAFARVGIGVSESK
jgi:hypothetical protein